MALAIETFSNVKGGNALYKALSHPAARDGARRLVDRLAKTRSVAVYDPFGFAAAFGVYPRRSTAALTRRRVSGATTSG